MERGVKRDGGAGGAPAGAGVIVDIQRGKYAISRAHKFSQSDEPPRAKTWPPRFPTAPSAASSPRGTRGSRFTYARPLVYRSVHITCVHLTTRAPTPTPTRNRPRNGDYLSRQRIDALHGASILVSLYAA